MENKSKQITIDGKQIVNGRMKFFERAIDILKSQNPGIDLDLYDILITLIPKVAIDGKN